VAERFAVGDRVVVRLDDPTIHTRAPRYVRGRSGTVLELHGRHPLPDAVVAGVRPAPVEPVYAVRFDAAELFGAGTHTVIVNLWDTYLSPVDPGGTQG
jgi:nitrile hydratase